MKITKIGHCCLLLEIDGVRIMTDPGSYSTAQNEEMAIDAVIISHEHGDHLHIESLEAVLKNNPAAQVISNASVAKILVEKGIACTVIEGTAAGVVKNVAIKACDARHEEIYEEIGQVQNTGYHIGNLFYPGDSFAAPETGVEILALPVSGPWCKIADSVRYALRVKPQKAFPVHDATLVTPGMAHAIPEKVLSAAGITFTSLKVGESVEF